MMSERTIARVATALLTIAAGFWVWTVATPAHAANGFYALFRNESEADPRDVFLGQVTLNSPSSLDAGIVSFESTAMRFETNGIAPLGTNPFVWAPAANPSDERFYALLFGITGAATVVTFDASDSTIVGMPAPLLFADPSPPPDPTPVSMPVRMVYDTNDEVIFLLLDGLDAADRQLATLDPTTGFVTLVGNGWSADLDGQATFKIGNAAIDPNAGELYFVGLVQESDTLASLFAVDLDAGTLRTAGTIDIAGFGASTQFITTSNAPAYLTYDSETGRIFGDAWERDLDSGITTRFLISIDPMSADAQIVGTSFSYYAPQQGVSGWNPGLRRFEILVKEDFSDDALSLYTLNGDAEDGGPALLASSGPLRFPSDPPLAMGTTDFTPHSLVYHATFAPEPSPGLLSQAAIATLAWMAGRTRCRSRRRRGP